MIIFSLLGVISVLTTMIIMGKIKEIHLSSAQTSVPENGYQHARAHFLRQRCLAVLLKSQGLSSPKIAEKVDLCRQSINKRVSGFLSAGIEGLENRPGRVPGRL
jgi:DNA-binding NarL/FixJ family response regulator